MVENDLPNAGDSVKRLRDPVLTFMHAWYLGDDSNNIMRNAMTSFTMEQLEEASKLLRTTFPDCGAFKRHRTSDKFVSDILADFKFLGDNNVRVDYFCSSLEMRRVKGQFKCGI